MARRKRVEWITQAELGRRLGLTGRHVYRLAEEPNFPMDKSRKGRDRVPWPEANHWYIEHRLRSAESRRRPKTIDQSRASKLEAEARIAQMEAAKFEGTLILLEHHEEVVGELLATLRAGLAAVPGSWAPRLVGCKTIQEVAARLQPLIAETITGLAAEVEDLDEGDTEAA